MSVPSDLAPFPVDSQVRVHMFAPSKLEPFPLEVQMGFVFMVVSSALSAAAGSGCLLYIAVCFAKSD
jgi:hypothetical protein